MTWNGAVHLSRGFLEYASELRRSRRLILDLTRREFRARYLGSALGLVWAFVHPSIMMLIFWLVFRYGLKAGPIGNVPYVVWLLTGLIPWYFISDSISTGANVVLDNRFLVKKVVFRVSLLPVVRLLSLLPVHLFFLAVLIGICWIDGFPPTPYTLQVFYYLGLMIVFGVGLSWLLSALVPFLKDLTQVVQVALQVLFWATPLVWPVDSVPPNRRWILNLNPFYYIVQGYRESLVDHVWFWRHPLLTSGFWVLTIVTVSVGGIVFLRLQSHFADVL